MATGDDGDSAYKQREAFIRASLEANRLMPVVEQNALKRGFTQTQTAVQYVIEEFARDEEAYHAAVKGAYEPEQYALMIDIYLARLEETVQKRQGNRTPDSRTR